MSHVTNIFRTGAVIKNLASAGKVHQNRAQRDASSQPASQSSGETSTIERSTSQLEKAARNLDRRLSLSVDNATGKVVFQIIDNSTGDIVRQIPPEEMLEFVAKFDEIRGLFFNNIA